MKIESHISHISQYRRLRLSSPKRVCCASVAATCHFARAVHPASTGPAATGLTYHLLILGIIIW